MSKPNLNGFLAGALNPRPRGKSRQADREALSASEEAGRIGLNSRFSAPAPRVEYRHDPDRRHYSELLGEPLTDEELKSIPTELHVWVLGPKGSKLISTHRVGPRKYFGLKWTQFPTEAQIEFCEAETLRCAQRAAWAALLEGTTRIEIRSYRRKEARSRFYPGPVIHGLVGVMTSVGDTLILGEPTEKALEVDAEYGI